MHAHGVVYRWMHARRVVRRWKHARGVVRRLCGESGVCARALAGKTKTRPSDADAEITRKLQRIAFSMWGTPLRNTHLRMNMSDHRTLALDLRWCTERDSLYSERDSLYAA
jgi:hypothetical protein